MASSRRTLPPRRRDDRPAPAAGPGASLGTLRTRSGFETGDWSVDPSTGRLRHRDGEERHLRPQEMDVLCCLAAAAGEVVPRERILDTVWPDAEVEEGAVSRCISLIRKALGDEARAPRYIETIPKRGYRFIAPLEPHASGHGTGGPSHGADATAHPAAHPEPDSRHLAGRSRLLLVAATVLVAITLGSGSRPAVVERAGGTARDLPTVAVLGFENLRGAEDSDWLETALAEMLVTELASAADLRVVAGETVTWMKRDLSLSSSASLAPETLARIRENLGADLVVVGSYWIQSAEADRGAGAEELRLDLKLQDTASGDTVSGLVTSGRLDRLADLVASSGARLRERLGASPPPRRWTPPASHLPRDPEAVRLYAEGLGKSRRFEAPAARDLLLAAIRREPHQPLAHLALAETWKALGHDTKAEEAARTAFEQRTGLSRDLQLWIEANYHSLTGRWDEAIDLYDALWLFAPGNLEYAFRLADTQNAAERPADALATVERIRQRAVPGYADPRLALISAEAARQVGDFERVQRDASTAIELGEALAAPIVVARGHHQRALALYKTGDFAAAMAVFERARESYGAAGDRRSEAQVQQTQAGWLTIRGGFDRAEELIGRSLAAFRAAGDRAGTATTLKALGDLKRQTGNHDAAAESYRQALVLDRQTNRRSGEASALNGLAIVAAIQSRGQEAEALFGQAIELYEEIGSPARVATIRVNLGKLYLLESTPLQARLHLGEAERLARELDLVETLAGVRFNQGYAAWLLGEPREATAAFSDCLELFRQLENPIMIAASQQGLGEAHLLLGDLESARAYIQEALSSRLEIARGAGSGKKVSVAESHIVLSRILLELGRFGDAEQMAQTAVETVPDTPALIALARVLLERDRIAEAEELAAEAGERLRRVDRVSELLLLHRVLDARLQDALGDPLGARETLGETISEARARGAWTLSAPAELHLGILEVDAGEHQAGEARLAALEAEARKRGASLWAEKASRARARGVQARLRTP